MSTATTTPIELFEDFCPGCLAVIRVPGNVAVGSTLCPRCAGRSQRWLFDRLRMCEEALRAWETWRAANESKVNGAIVLATIHGCRYTGDAWPDKQGREALAALAEHGEPR